MAVISMKQLLEAGVHFGHQTRRWNPKMTRLHLHRAQRHLHHRPAKDRSQDRRGLLLHRATWPCEGKSILFVGTKKQAQESIESEAKRCNMFYVNHRWLGGMLTNFKTIRAAHRPPEPNRRRWKRTAHFESPAQEGSRQADASRRKSCRATWAVSRDMSGTARRAVRGGSTQGAHRRGGSPGACTSRSSASWIPTAIPTRWITSFPAMTTPSAPSS